MGFTQEDTDFEDSKSHWEQEVDRSSGERAKRRRESIRRMRFKCET
jgi:hypothetical protein